jgi:hypothetical protein
LAGNSLWCLRRADSACPAYRWCRQAESAKTGLRLAFPGKLNLWREGKKIVVEGNLLLTLFKGMKKTGLGHGERSL